MLNNGAEKACHARGDDVHEKSVVGAAACGRGDACVGARKKLRVEDFALGAGLAFAAEGAGGLGGRGRKGFRRHHQVQGVSGAAARQGVRPLRHGARWHRRRHLRQSGLPAGPFPDHRRRRIAVPDVGSQGRLDGARRVVSQICREGDEGRQVLSRLRPFALVVSFADQEDRGARRHQGHDVCPRPPPLSTLANFVTQLGGTNVQSSAPEVRDIIERGVADAVTFPWGSLLLFGLDKVTKYDMEAPLYVTTFAFVINKDKYDQMSDKQKKAIDNNCNTETAGKVGELWGKMEDAGIDKIKAESGHEVYKLTPEQIGLWKKASEPLTKTWGDGVKKNGGDPDAAMAELRAALKKYNALAE